MKSKRKKFWSGDNRFRLMLTLELAVMLPAAALVYFNFHYIDSIKRNGKVETLIHSEFQYVLGVSEKKINQKIYSMTEEVRGLFPPPDIGDDSEKERKLDIILAKTPWLAHVFLFDAEKGFLFRSQPQQMGDKDFREEHERLTAMYRGWFNLVRLHDNCLLSVSATPKGQVRVGWGQLRSHFPEANLLSGNARRADHPEVE
jgi:hypothetical protein